MMPSTSSVGQMIVQLVGLLGTDAVNEWEEDFIGDIVTKTETGRKTTHLTSKQVEKVEQLYRRHFA